MALTGSHVVSLGSARDVASVGGKAASLGALIRAGFPVPPGFCVTTRAFEAFVSAGDLGPVIEGALQAVDVERAESLEAAAAFIQSAFARVEVPAEVEQAIIHEYRGLGASAVAVRSSGTLEDLAVASFAGQHDTYLNALGDSDVIARVRECWASLYNATAIQYRAERGMNYEPIALAVVIQTMVQAEVSGMAFTANPVSGDRREIHLTSSYALGEEIASGRVTPDLLVYRRPDSPAPGSLEHLVFAYAEIGEKSTMLHAQPEGGVEELPVPAEQRAVLSLPINSGLEVARLADRLAEHFGAPQDVEWAIERGVLSLLQSRPMVMPAPSVSWESPVAEAHWQRNWRLGEWLADPVTPLFASTLLPALVGRREEYGSGRIDHLGWGQPLTFTMHEPWYCIVNGYFFTRQDRDVATESFGRGTPRERAERNWGQLRWLANWRRTHRRRYQVRLRRLQRFDPATASAAVILRFLEGLYWDAAEWWYLIARIGFGSETATFLTQYNHLITDANKPDAGVFFTGFNSQALRSQRVLHLLAQAIEKDPSLCERFLSAAPEDILADLVQGGATSEVAGQLKSYLARHGHQVFSLDFHEPTLAERPEGAVAAIQSYLRYHPEPPGIHVERQQRRRWAANAFVRRALQDRPEEWYSFEAALKFRQECARNREDAIYDFQRLWPLMRRGLAVLGTRLAERAVIAEGDDIYFLTRDELTAAAAWLDGGESDDGRPQYLPVVAARRDEWESQRRLSAPDRIPPPSEDEEGESIAFGSVRVSPGRVLEDEQGRRLVGQAASPGRATGPARLVRSSADFGRFQQGDVLVAVNASPASTVLFPLAAAIVTEVGGSATHSSLVAREYRIPTVVATGVATQVIRDGQLITVDGTRGVVYLSERPGLSAPARL